MNPLLKMTLGDYSSVGLNNKDTRLKWIQDTLTGLPKGWKILDAGAGERPFKPYCAHMEYVSQDFGQYDGKGDGKGIQAQAWDNTKLDYVCDITSIPVQAASFDAVMCTEVLEHVPHPVDAVKEMVRILKPGGKLIITAPFASLTHFAPYHFATGFNRYFYEYWMKELNCEIKELTLNGNYFEWVAQELRHCRDVGQKYAGLQMTLKEKLAQRIMLSFLRKASSRGGASSELLPFGVMMVAVKK